MVRSSTSSVKKMAGDKAKESKSHEKARSKAEEYAKSPEKLNALLDKASEKASSKKGPLVAVWTQLMASFRLLRAYAKGSYREIPWQSLIMIIASVIYFVMPIDALPDFIAGLGYLDDAALLGWTIQSVDSDIEEFVSWEQRQ